MRQYYTYDIAVDSAVYYCIWYTNDRDGLLASDGQITSFPSSADRTVYAKARLPNLRVSRAKTELFSSIKQFRKKARTRRRAEGYFLCDCAYVLEMWNLYADAAASVNAEFYGNRRALCGIYDKLFWGNNIPAVTPEGAEYMPRWSGIEWNEILRVRKNGMAVIKREHKQNRSKRRP